MFDENPKSEDLEKFQLSVQIALDMGPRWKGKGSEAKALSEPMSRIVSELRSSLTQPEAQGLLSGSNVLLCLGPQQADSLNRACFGVPIATPDKDKQWFQLGLEEAFYLCHALKCLEIVNKLKSFVNESDLWHYMKSKRENFPEFSKAYSHLRAKNWVVTSGVRYGADFVAYRHHPGLAHSEFAVLVSCLEGYGVSERVIARWLPERCREERSNRAG